MLINQAMKSTFGAIFKLVLFQFLILPISFARQKCKNNTTCIESDQEPVVRGRVRYARSADITMAPWQVSLRKTRDVANREDNKPSHFCGGSWISLDWVLTAAHCIYESNRMPLGEPKTGEPVMKRKDWSTSRPGMWVAFGETEIGEYSGWQNGKKTKEKLGLRRVQKYIIHKDYNHEESFDSDIALLLLDPIKDSQLYHFRTLLRDRKIAFIKLPYPYQKQCKNNDLNHSSSKSGKELTVSGWGDTLQKDGGRVEMKLREGTVQLNTMKYCQGKYGKRQHITQNMICAVGEIKTTQNKRKRWVDAAAGDSGGPLVTKLVDPDLKEDGENTTVVGENFIANSKLLGLVSAGLEDFTTNRQMEYVPGIYTKVCKFYLWIAQTLIDENLDYPGSMCPTKLIGYEDRDKRCTDEKKNKMVSKFKDDYKMTHNNYEKFAEFFANFLGGNRRGRRVKNKKRQNPRVKHKKRQNRRVKHRKRQRVADKKKHR